MNQTVTYLQELTAIPSPTGFTQELRLVCSKGLKNWDISQCRQSRARSMLSCWEKIIVGSAVWLPTLTLWVLSFGLSSHMAGSNWTSSVAFPGIWLKRKTVWSMWLERVRIILVHQTSSHVYNDAGIESSHSYERTHIDSVVATERMVDVYLKSGLVVISN